MLRSARKRCLAAVCLALGALAVGLPAHASSSSGTFVRLIDNGNSMCMGVSGGVMTNGRPVIQWPCNGHDDQYWQWDGGNPHVLKDFKDPTKCLDGSGQFHTGPLVINTCNGSTYQQWTYIDPNFSGKGYLQNVGTGGYATGVLGQGVQVDQYNGSPVPNWPFQLWSS